MQLMNFRPLVAAALVCVATLGLSGCANPINDLVEKGTDQAIENIAEDSTGGQVDIDAGGGASLPADWPNLPVPEGEITLSTNAADGMTVAFNTTQAEAESVLEQLLASGFTEESSSDTGDGKMVLLTGAEWNVMLSWVAEGSERDAVLLSYVVTPVTQ